MNYAAIDAGATAYHKVEVPAYWAEATDDAAAESVTGLPKTVKMVENILNPIDKMDGDSCLFPPLSTTSTAPSSSALPHTRSAA